MFQATFVHCRDPFRPRVNSRIEPIRRAARIDTVLRRQGLISGGGRALKRHSTFVVCINQRALLQSEWGRLVRAGEVLTVIALPRNGGQGSNPLAMVLQIALVIGSAIILGPGAFGVAGLGLQGGQLIAATAIVNIAGSMLINAVLPPSSAKYAQDAPSPTYSIAGQGNSARVGASVPRWYGRMRVYPDYAAQPYTENAGNQQTLYQLFCLTQGYVQIEQIRIGDTDISTFGADLKYEVIEPGGRVTLFPDNVVTSADVSSLEAKASNEKADTDPITWTYILGPFVTNPATTQTNAIGIDLTLPGLGRASETGGLTPSNITFRVEAQQINDSGVAIGDWVTLDNHSLTFATASPQLLSVKYAVAPGRYQVRLYRTDQKDTDSRAINTLMWSGMRAYLPSKRTYGNVTLIAMEITATNNLNSTNAKQLNVIGTGKVPVYDGATWSAPVATRSIAWAIADMCRSPDYGAGLADNRLNLAELFRLETEWLARGETLDGIFDTTRTFWDALTAACYVGRAVPMYYAGVIEVVRDEPKTHRTAMFTPFNMLVDTFEAEFAMKGVNPVDCVDVTYTDPDSWEPMTVRCALADSQQKNPKAMTVELCTNRNQAHALGMYMAACNRDQLRFITFKTEFDGYIPKYGDLVAVSHDVASYGQSGWVTADVWDPETGVLQTSEALEWTAGVTHYIQFRNRAGEPAGPYVAERGASDNTVILSQMTPGQRADLYVSDGYDEERTYYQFGPSIETVALNCVMLKALPADDDTIELNMVSYATSVYEAENSVDVPPPPAASQLVTNPNAPQLTGLSVQMTQTDGLVMIAAAAAAGANTYEFGASSDGGNSWQDIGSSVSPRASAQLSVGPWKIRARALGILPGPWVYWTGTVSTIVYAPGAPTLTLQQAFTGLSLVVNVSGSEAADYFEVSVIVGGVVKTTYTTAARQLTWSIDDARNYDGVSPAVTFSVAAANAAGTSAPTYLAATNPAPVAPTITLAENHTTLTISPHGESDLATVYVGVGDADQDGSDTTTPYKSGPPPLTIDSIPSRLFVAYMTDVWGNQSPSASFFTPEADTGGGGGGGGG